MKKLYKCDSKLRIYLPSLSPDKFKRLNKVRSSLNCARVETARKPLVKSDSVKYNLAALMKRYLIDYQTMQKAIKKSKPMKEINVDCHDYEELKNKMLKAQDQFANEFDFSGMDNGMEEFEYSNQKTIKSKMIEDDYNMRLKGRMDESEYDDYGFAGFNDNNNNGYDNMNKDKQKARFHSSKSKEVKGKDKYNTNEIEEEKNMLMDFNDNIKDKEKNKKGKKHKKKGKGKKPSQSKKNNNKNKDFNQSKSKDKQRDLFLSPNDKNDYEQIEKRVISSAKERQSNQIKEEAQKQKQKTTEINKMLQNEAQIKQIQRSYRKYEFNKLHLCKSRVYIGLDQLKKNLIKIYLNKIIETPGSKHQVLSLYVQIYSIDKMTTYNEIVTIADLKELNIISKSKVSKEFIKAQKENIAKKLFIQYDKKLESELKQSIDQFSLVNQGKDKEDQINPKQRYNSFHNNNNKIKST